MRKTKVLTADCDTGIDKYLNSSIRLNRNLNINAERPGLEIIELDESSSSESEDEVRSKEYEHPWCYSNVNIQRMEDDNNNINKNAREKWRMKNKIHPGVPSKNAGYSCQESRINSNRAYTGSMNYVWDHIAKRDTQSINTLNCFAIVKNDIGDSDSSSDKENSIEITECGDVVLERDQLCNDDDLKKTKCNNRLDTTRTILIYSFKNRSMLSGDDNQLFESSPDSTSDSSLDNFERVHFDDINVSRNRVPSPAPASYIPRLDFFAAATLPTVAEAVEPYQLSSENIQSHKGTSSWFPPDRSSLEGSENKLHENELLDKRQKVISPIHPHIPSNDIINWMALSPRKRIKVFKIPDPSDDKHVLENNLISAAQKAKYNTNRDDEIVSTNVPDVKTHNEKNPDVCDATDECIILKEINNQLSMDEKGDRKKIKQLKKPQIRLEKMTTNNIITDPIEKLDGEEWIGLENEPIDKPDFDMDASKDSDDYLDKPKLTNRCAGDRLFRRNISLLRPVEWAEYLPITESIPSLHLSLPSDINDCKRSWFKLFIELFQRCIKCK